MTISLKKIRAAFLRTAIAATAIVAVAGSALAAEAGNAAGGPPVVRRLTSEQYQQVIADVFGRNIKIGGRFEPGVREGGLLAVGSSRVSVTPSGFEQYDGMARGIAGQVVSPDHRAVLLPCKPAADNAPDNACATQFITRAGRLLYRRALTPAETEARVKVAGDSATSLKNFYTGLATSLADMLVSPQFLFRKQVAESDPEHSGAYRLDAASKASQLSFFLWDSAPDEELLAAVESGELGTQKGLAKQVDRMLASPRLEGGLRAFFTDMLGFDEFGTLSKDAAIYPKFNAEVSRDAQEQTLKTLSDLLITRRADYRDIFTSPHTFLTPILGTIYGVPVPKITPNGVPDRWQAYEYPAGDPRAGILAQASFVALHSHPGRSSPTLRGKALREIVLCQKVPDPPANVNFTVVQDTNNPEFKTARTRLEAHRTNPACAGCHKLIDPMGLALENFDSSGAYRKTENDAAIDASGELDGTAFTDGVGLGKAVHDNPGAPACLVSRVASYGLGRVTAKAETNWLKALEKNFATDGYRFPDLLRRIATSEEFYRISAPRTGALDMPASRLASGPLSQGGEQ